MKRFVSLLLGVVLIFSLSIPAFAAEETSISGADDANDIKVRVNGEIVSFPDQGPVIDSNSRTLVPVRFATEALGATVTWNDTTHTATISKNGISVDVAIGKKDITVTKGDDKTTTTMDTEAVLINNRTMVPIRFIAEALGAYVDWSDSYRNNPYGINRYRVIGIYQSDELTSEQMRSLMAEPMTVDSFIHIPGTLRPFSGEWADAREMVFRNSVISRHYRALNKDILPKTEGEQVKYIIEEAKAAIECHSANLDITFATNPCLVYSQLAEAGAFPSVRGYVTVNMKGNPNDMTDAERDLIFDTLGMKHGRKGETQAFAIDAHVMIVSTTDVQFHEVEGLASAQKAGYTWELGHNKAK